MQQSYTYYCPSCQSPVTWGEANCRRCGAALDWNFQQTPATDQSSQGNLYNYTPQDWGQQYGQNNQQGYGQYGEQGYNQMGGYYSGQGLGQQGGADAYAGSQGVTSGRDSTSVRSMVSRIIVGLMVFMVLAGGAVVLLGMSGKLFNPSSGNTTAPQSAKPVVTTPVAPPAIISLTATPSSITAGESTELKWNTSGATSVTLDQGVGPVALTGMSTVSPKADTTYTLTASNSTAAVTTSVAVAVIAAALPSVTSFTLNPSKINYGESTTLAWSVTGATSISIDQGVGTVNASGSLAVTPTAPVTYTLTATNKAGSATAKAAIAMIPGKAPVITSFTASPTEIARGGSSTLKWKTSGASSISLEPGFGTVDASGTLQVSPTETTSYTLTTINAGNTVKATATVSVPSSGNPVVSSFTASPGTIPLGQSSTLRWSVTGATSISINQNVGTVDGSGSTAVSPTAHTTYTLTATNAMGSTTATVVVSVTQASATGITAFTASPTTIAAGQASVLQWDVTSATDVAIDNDVGAVARSGTTSVSPQETTTYTLTATGSSGAITSTVTVTVVLPGTPVISSFAAVPSSVAAGHTSALEWSVAGADSITIDNGIGIVTSSSVTVTPTVTTVYTLTATGYRGSRTATATVTVTSADNPVINTFTANPPNTAEGQPSTLYWNVTGATSVSIDQGVGLVSDNGTAPVLPATTTTYTLTASNDIGTATRTVTVTVSAEGAPVITNFSASPASIASGQSSTLQWSAAGATSVTIDPGMGSLPSEGTQTVSPTQTTTYLMTATNSQGSVNYTVTVTVQ
jgi:hypothetical protein